MSGGDERRRLTRRQAIGLGAVGLILEANARPVLGAEVMKQAADDPVPVLHPKKLGADKLPAQRIAVGVPDDYKPCVALLPGGELLLVAFHQHKLGGGKIREDMLLFRSRDGGRTWSSPQTLDLLGREPYFSVLRHGTVFVTVHLIKQDVRNTLGCVHSYLHRSTDAGKTWATLPITAEDLPGAPENAWVHTSRNVLELADGSLILGVSAPKGIDFLWRSADKGKTWDKGLACAFHGIDKAKLWWPLMAETVFCQAPNGDLLGLFRVDPRVFPALSDIELPKELGDQVERLVVFRSTDGGQNWRLDKELGSWYGEMYPAVLRLNDGRLLLTFTVRSLRPPLGVRAVLGAETPNGFVFDFKSDRVVLSAKTPEGKSSGGGFGPTILLSDGTLVTAYSYRTADDKTHLEVVRWRLP